jgi:hypothetical protein
LELCAAFDGSLPSSYAANLLSFAVLQDIERSPILSEQWAQIEQELLEKGSWEGQFSPLEKLLGEGPTKKRDSAIKGWSMAGSHPQDYEQGIDANVTFDGNKSAYLKSKEQEVEGFGTLMQKFRANIYHGKRLRFSAYVKAEEVEGWAGLWMRIDGSQGAMLGFDNMQTRPIKGTIDWHEYEVILDVHQGSKYVAFGILLHGCGQVWLSNIQFSEVSSNLPTTDVTQEMPENLDFAL